MSHIYKIAHTLENNDIKKIYVFYGTGTGTDVGLDVLFKKDTTNPQFHDIFSNAELEIIREKDISVTFLPIAIYPDDSIETIKEKIIQFCGLNCAFSEMYLFAQQKEILNSLMIFQTLTQNEKLDLTRERLVQYLLNISSANEVGANEVGANEVGANEVGAITNEVGANEVGASTNEDTTSFIDQLADKPLYTYDDILALNLDNKEMLVTIPIGQKFVALDKNIQYTINPFSVLMYDTFLERYAQDITSTTNKNLLMNVSSTGTGTGIYNNMLYVCLAEDVLNYTNTQGLSQESTIKIYFPYLLEKQILTLRQLQEQKQELLVASDLLITANFEKENEVIALYYGIYKNRTQELAYYEQGTRELEFILHPAVEFNLPLDIVFKLIHATRNVPLIKYNPAKKQDKLYRLYTDKIATNGKKIPYLDKSVINRLAKTIGKTKQVSAYIEYRIDDTLHPIICNFENNGSIHIKANFQKTYSVERLNAILQEALNPVIDIVKDYLSQNGYVLRAFTSLLEPTIELLSMDYIIHVPITKQIKLKNVMGCVATVFNVLSDDMKNGIVMRFKRVANYNEMDSIDAFITEMLNREENEEDILEQLISNYSLTPKKAQTKLADFVSSLQVVQDAFQHRRLKIKNNPGFLTTIHQEQFNKNLIITITGINNMNYLQTLPIYIDSFVRLTQQTLEQYNIEKICKPIKHAKSSGPEQIVDIISTAEQVNNEHKQMNIVAQELVFEEEGTGDGNGEGKGEDMFDFFFGNEGEEGGEEEGEGEEEGPSEGEDIEFGGAGPSAAGPSAAADETLELDITGKRLTHPNPFQERIVNRDPNLFVTYKDENFKDYSRSCPWSNRRHPVILTDEEKAKIDKEHPGSYDARTAIKYGSDKDKQFWYICPRYWSLKDNTTLTDAEVASGKYGKVIPREGKKIGKGEAIFEFNDDVYHKGKNGEYGQLYPGFLKPSPQGKCLPCCFKVWDSEEQKGRRDICAVEQKETAIEEAAEDISTPAVEPTVTKKVKKNTLTDDYIKGADKYPLDPNRYGYLPLAIQHFLQTDNKKCQISLSNTNLKPGHVCMVRRGVEFSKTQSFLACIADIYSSIHHLDKQSLVTFKETLVNAMDIDTFLSLQNGNLVNIFTQDALLALGNETLDLTEFANSRLFNKKQSKIQQTFFIKVAHAFNNFKEYLRDTTIDIDYTYVWDLICQPNAKLFKKGLNLAIVEMSNNDITNNVNLVCPSNHYAGTFFDDYKDTVIIIKREKQFENKIYNLYEPVYAIEDRKKEFAVTYGFRLNSLININATIELIKRSFGKCGPYPSMPKVYEFKRNIPLMQLAELLDLKAYVVVSQVLNYNGQVIGVIAQKKARTGSKKVLKGFLPCFPSAFLKYLDTDYLWMDADYSDTYVNTLAFLNMVYKDLNGRIPCKPKMKVIEDELIVGILTETNQFIGLSEPVMDTFGSDLLEMDSQGLVGVDLQSETDPAVDAERVTYINNIRLESKFYNVFRNSVRLLLGQMRYRSIKNDIETLIGSPVITYLQKLKQVDALLRQLMTNSVDFSVYEPGLIDDIVNCQALSGDKTDASNKCATNKFCLEKQDGSCALVVPKVNLINGTNNEVVYFEKMADELIRYNRIKSFIFQPNVFLSFTHVKYNLTDTEIILLQSLLMQEYFEGLVVAPVNKYIKHNTFDTAQPLKTQNYGNEVAGPGPGAGPSQGLKCPEPTSILVTSPYWKPIFPENSIEVIFYDSPALCTFDIMLVLLKNSNLTKNDLKEILVEEYLFYYTDYKFEIIETLKLQGKHKVSKQLINKTTTLANLIMSEDYYATNLDLWLLAKHYDLPVIFFSGTELIENGEKFLVAHTNAKGEFKDHYYFIRSPGIKNDVPNVYRLIAAPEYNELIPLSALQKEFSAKVTAAVIETSDLNALDAYLEKVGKLDATIRLKAKKVKIVVEEEAIQSETQAQAQAQTQTQTEKASKKVTKLKKKLVLSE